MKRLCKIFFPMLLFTVSCPLQAASEFEIYPELFTERPGFEINYIENKKPLKKRILLITGCARSGTTFITRFFRLNGYDVGHEQDGLFGVVSWPMTANANITPWGPAFNGYAFEHIFHQVRHPLKTIASAGNEPPISWAYIRKSVPEIKMRDPKIVKGAKYWYYWNLLGEKKAELTYRIEDIENYLPEMTALLEVDLDPSILDKIPTNTNTRGYSDVYTWDDLRKALDKDLFSNIVQMTIRYGYDVSDL